MEMPGTRSSARNPLLATLSKRLDERRQRHARWLLRFRLVASTLVFAIVSWRAAEVPGMAPTVATYGTWAGAGVVLWLLSGRVPALLRHYWVTLVLFDVPLVSVAFYLLIPSAPAPTRIPAIACTTLMVFTAATAAA